APPSSPASGFTALGAYVLRDLRRPQRLFRLSRAQFVAIGGMGGVRVRALSPERSTAGCAPCGRSRPADHAAPRGGRIAAKRPDTLEAPLSGICLREALAWPLGRRRGQECRALVLGTQTPARPAGFP